MDPRDLQQHDWERLDEAEARALAGALAAALPLPVVFEQTATHSYAGRSRRTALFRYDGSLFALIPGTEARLGYDASRFRPSAAQLRSYRDSAEELGIDPDIAAFVQQMTTPPRTVTTAPFLLEIRAHSIAEWLGSDACVIHQEIVDRLAAEGLRLPSADEWEYACGGGAQTLFRWGDDCPWDRYPTDTPDWDQHLRPNAFGLSIGQDPYRWEVVAEPLAMRGGDGGTAICGGMGFFLGWLPLATAWDSRSYEELLVENPDRSEDYLRRVIPLR